MIDYTGSTIAELKVEIDRRTQGEAKPYNSKTRKGELIEWLTQCDARDTAEIEAGQAEIDKRNAEDEAAQRKAFRMAPVVRLTERERTENYYRQNGGYFLTKRQQRQIGRMIVRSAVRWTP